MRKIFLMFSLLLFLVLSNVTGVLAAGEVVQTPSATINLFDYEATKVEDFIINIITGVVEASATGHYYSQYIEITGGVTYAVVGYEVSLQYGAWYDSSFTFISSTNNQELLVAPANAVYIRLSNADSIVYGDFMFYDYTSGAQTYVAYDVETVGPAQFLFDIGSFVATWIVVLLSTLGAVTTAILTNPIALVVISLFVTLLATRFGFGLIRKLIGIFR